MAAATGLRRESSQTFVQSSGGHRQECVIEAELFAGFASVCSSVTEAVFDV
jgi:hypothetical protein